MDGISQNMILAQTRTLDAIELRIRRGALLGVAVAWLVAALSSLDAPSFAWGADGPGSSYALTSFRTMSMMER